LIGLSSLGGVLGAALASLTVSRFGSARTYLAANVATAPFMLLLPASGPGWRLALFAAGSFVVLASATMSGVITVTFRGNYIPGHLLGRVTAATGFVVAGTVPLGAAAAGALATGFGIRTAMWVLATLFAVMPLPLLGTSLRTMRELPGGVAGVHALLNTDPPDHTRLRRLVQKAFTPRRAAQLRPRTAEIAASLLDQMTAGGDVVDLLGGYARPLPITVISELLGIPVADREWIRITVTDYGKGGEELQRVPQELGAYFARLITARRAEPGSDLLSALVLAHDNATEDGGGDALTTAGLLSAAYHQVMAGFDATVNLIASGTLALLTHPGEMARLRQDPSLLPAAVEELLRFTSPVDHVPPGSPLRTCPSGTW
jgi:hypothetical protein